jgi:hypothetical protein
MAYLRVLWISFRRRISRRAVFAPAIFDFALSEIKRKKRVHTRLPLQHYLWKNAQEFMHKQLVLCASVEYLRSKAKETGFLSGKFPSLGKSEFLRSTSPQSSPTPWRRRAPLEPPFFVAKATLRRKSAPERSSFGISEILM